jgi:hypothetical protein
MKMKAEETWSLRGNKLEEMAVQNRRKGKGWRSRKLVLVCVGSVGQLARIALASGVMSAGRRCLRRCAESGLRWGD